MTGDGLRPRVVLIHVAQVLTGGIECCLSMRVTIRFYSYFKDLTGCSETTEELPAGGTLGSLFERLTARFPNLAAMQKATLMAVGVEYQNRSYILREGDEVSLFPPVQGG